MSKETDAQVILEADACRSKGDDKGMFAWIQKGLADNCQNYELYFMLGEYYLDKNPHQAYLCFENAGFYCDNEEDMAVIRQAEQQLADVGGGYSSGGVGHYLVL